VAGQWKFIFSTWNEWGTFVCDNNPSGNCILDVNVVAEAFNEPIYWWEPSHSIFNYPESVPNFNGISNSDKRWLAYEPLDGSYAIAGYNWSYTPNEANIVINSDNRTIINGILLADNDSDADNDGINDAVELWKNEITFLLEGERYINIIQPNGGEVWNLGSTVEILWDDNIDGEVSILLIINESIPDAPPGGLWTYLTANTPDDGSFTWTIPTSMIDFNNNSWTGYLPSSDNYKICISSVTYSSLFGATEMCSDNYFTITANPELFVNPVDINLGTNSSQYSYSSNFTIKNEGSGLLTGYITTNSSWITSFSQSSFNLNLDEQISITFSGLFPSNYGPFDAYINITSNGGNEDIFIHGVVETPVFGCTDLNACNYNSLAEVDNGSCLYFDECEVCGGNNLSCADCADVPNGNNVEDNCDTCDNDPSNDCVQDCLGNWGGTYWESDCGCVAADNSGDDCDDCDGVANGDNVEDNCGTCDNDSSNDCIQDCNGEWGGDAYEDGCVVCDADSSNDNADDLGCGCFKPGPSGCDNECGSILENDECEVCGGNNLSCADCADVPNGNNVEDNCDTCDNDPSNDCVQDCLGNWGGTYWESDCGCVAVDNSGDDCDDCNGDPDGEAYEDSCGVCSGGNSSHVADSDIDECGVCGGDNSSCADCVDVPNGDSICLDFGNINTTIGTLEILYTSNNPISGFQFNISNLTITGGVSVLGQLWTDPSSSLVVGLGTQGEVILPGSGVLVTLVFEPNPTEVEVCLTNAIIGYTGGVEYPIEFTNECTTIPACTDLGCGCNNPALTTYYTDTDGDGFGTGEGIEFCEDPGDGWSDNAEDEYPNCAANFYDCNEDCGGTAEPDSCGVCSGGNSGHVADSDIDDCGVCDGGNADQDCAGDCFGSSYVDNCGTCDADGSNDCVQDCAGVWVGWRCRNIRFLL